MTFASFDSLLFAALALFWIGMLGLLWRRSLLGMLVGVAFGWLSVAVAGMAFVRVQPLAEDRVSGAAFVVCVGLISALQVALGLAIVFARVARRGSLDANDAGLLEG
jgi:NADH:ubiquinone oxidoreductase subunit K